MASYKVNHTCGHVVSHNLVGPHRYRESRLAYLERGECFDCFKQHSTEVAKEQAEELELPQLVGTEKQVAWAETLRIEKLNDIDTTVERLKQSKEYAQILVAVEEISNETSAKKWIDWRYDAAKYIIADVLKKLMSTPTVEQQRAEQEAREKADAIKRAALVEATIRPETPVSELAAEISLNGNTISIIFPEQREDFKEIVKKSLGYTWSNGCWQRVPSKFAGSPVERLVEVGHTLLSHGFLVRVFDEELRARIVAGTFEPEHTRWITNKTDGTYTGWLSIRWSKQEDYYAVARKLPNSKYNAPHVVVPPVQFAQVLDFAELYDFKLSNGAQEAVRIAREDEESMLVVTKEPVSLREKTVASDKPPILAIPESVEIDDDLKEAM